MVAHSLVEKMFYVKVRFQQDFLITTNCTVWRAKDSRSRRIFLALGLYCPQAESTPAQPPQTRAVSWRRGGGNDRELRRSSMRPFAMSSNL